MPSTNERSFSLSQADEQAADQLIGESLARVVSQNRESLIEDILIQRDTALRQRLATRLDAVVAALGQSGISGFVSLLAISEKPHKAAHQESGGPVPAFTVRAKGYRMGPAGDH